MLWFLLGVLLYAVDLAAKYLVYSNMTVGDSIPLIPDVFHLTFVHNTGAAFSIFAGNSGALSVVVAALLLGVLSYILIKRPRHPLLLLPLVMILAGGAGNLTDRLRFGYVVDFFDFRLIHFAVFNTADAFVVCGAVLLAVYLLFFDGKTECENGKDTEG